MNLKCFHLYSWIPFQRRTVDRFRGNDKKEEIALITKPSKFAGEQVPVDKLADNMPQSYMNFLYPRRYIRFHGEYHIRQGGKAASAPCKTDGKQLFIFGSLNCLYNILRVSARAYAYSNITSSIFSGFDEIISRRSLTDIRPHFAATSASSSMMIS